MPDGIYTIKHCVEHYQRDLVLPSGDNQVQYSYSHAYINICVDPKTVKDSAGECAFKFSCCSVSGQHKRQNLN